MSDGRYVLLQPSRLLHLRQPLGETRRDPVERRQQYPADRRPGIDKRGMELLGDGRANPRLTGELLRYERQRCRRRDALRDDDAESA